MCGQTNSCGNCHCHCCCHSCWCHGHDYQVINTTTTTTGITTATYRCTRCCHSYNTSWAVNTGTYTVVNCTAWTWNNCGTKQP